MNNFVKRALSWDCWGRRCISVLPPELRARGGSQRGLCVPALDVLGPSCPNTGAAPSGRGPPMASRTGRSTACADVTTLEQVGGRDTEALHKVHKEDPRSAEMARIFVFSALALLLLSACCWADSEQTEEDSELSVSELLERANSNLIRSSDDPILIDGDISIDSEAERNADPCTSRGCKWGKYTDGKVYIPYYIASHFSSREKSIITRGLESFSSFSCIRFRPSRSSDRDWLSIESQNGCYSYVGRRGGKQVVSLARRGCLYHGTVQHELLHALGFNHEQTRSDRDNHIKVLLHNVQSGMEHNFRKIATLNQGTPYDYNSVMQYHKYAFSKNNQPTMLPIPNSNAQQAVPVLGRLFRCADRQSGGKSVSLCSLNIRSCRSELIRKAANDCTIKLL
ncbi:Low choriolytic enzyme [Larimichthys crocea]|uniref:Metalloendopeptidase n=1 Tax=Larimichthys crocea TaxID=215358 RepID=A0A6G0IZK2_LARCR|nr:Low choriolytic enzyme [Larimichthys crocea]